MDIDKTRDLIHIPIFESTSSDWIRSVLKAIEIKGYRADRFSHGLVVWHPDLVTRLNNNLEATEAIFVSPESLCDKNDSKFIGLANKRLYFKDGERQPSYDQENTLLKGGQRKSVPVKQIIDQIINFGNLLINTNDFSALMRPSTPHDFDIISHTQAEGALSDFTLAKDMWKPSMTVGWKDYPQHLTIHFVGEISDVRSERFFSDYQKTVRDKWSKASRTNNGISFKAWSLSPFLERARNTNTKPTIFSENDIIVIAVTGKKGEPLPEPQSELMDILDSWKQQYRLVSLSTTKNSYWASTHVLSLLNGVGMPYALRLPFPESFLNGIFLGVDIGHNHSQNISNIVVSAMTPEGQLIVSIKQVIKLNESLDGSLITKMLKQIKNLAEKRQDQVFDQAIIIRDGRLPDNDRNKSYEIVQDYITALKIPTALVELRKRGNPPIILRDKSQIAVGVNFHPNYSNIRFATFYDSKIGLPNTFKVVLPQGGDGLGWGIDAYVNILCGLCYSPSLGSQPHLPGPIYWADGFAKTSKFNNQFRGHHVEFL